MIQRVLTSNRLGSAPLLDGAGSPSGWRFMAAIVAFLAALGALASPVMAGSFQTRQIEAPMVLELELDTDALVYDVCWSEHVSDARAELARQAVEQMRDPRQLHVLSFPQLPSDWQPLDRGALRDWSGDVISRSRLAIQKAAYQENVEAALLAIIEMIRDARPGARLAVEGFAPRQSRLDSAYEALFAGVDYAYVDSRLDSRLIRRDRSRPLDFQLRRVREWMSSVGLAEGRPLALRLDDETWLLVGRESLDEFLDASDEAWDEDAVVASDDASIDGESISTYETTARSEDAQSIDPHSDQNSPGGDRPDIAMATARSADLNADGVVNSEDRSMLLGYWGTDNSAADLNGDGVVNSADLAILLGNYDADTEAPTSAPNGQIVPDMDTYEIGSNQAMAFMVSEGDQEGLNVVFQVWSSESRGIEAAYTDMDPPFIYPGEMLNGVTPGPGQVQAIVRDGNYTQLATFAHDMEFVVSGDEDDGPSGPGHDNPSGSNDDFVLGMNVSGLTYYTREWAFTDIFKMSKDWSSSQPIEYHDDGWPRLAPGQSVNTLMFRGMAGEYPAGTYTVTWEGDGVVSVPGFDVDGASWSNPIADTTGEFTFTVSNPRNNGIALRIDESNPNNHVRNIRVIAPGYSPDSAPMFHPEFVERLRPFKIVRFMPWNGTGQTSTVDVSALPTPESPRQAGVRGVAPEYIAALSNEINADPWVCMPHLATDEYMRQYAEVMLQHLDPDRRVYIEFSNEVWNGIFQQAQWNMAEANRLGITFQEHYARQCLRLFEIWEDVFGDQSDRLIRVVGTQLVNHGVTNGILDHIPEGSADILSPASYFHINRFLDPSGITEDTPLEVIIDASIQGIEEAGEHMEWCVARAADKGMEVVAYEGGQHLANVFGGNHPSIEKFAQVNKDPRMYDLYMQHFERQIDAGAKGICHLTFVSDQDSQYGAWGSLDHQTQDPSEAPKYRALLDILEQQRQPVP